MTRLKTMLTKHEGKRNKPYQDTLGIWTIGVGRNLEDTGISDDTIDQMLMEDIARCEAEARTLNWYKDLNEARQAVIVMMIFNMGLPRFKKFKETIKYIGYKLYHRAANEMLDSRWAVQVGNRSHELSEMMRTGEWPNV